MPWKLPPIVRQNATAAGTDILGYLSESPAVSVFTLQGGAVYQAYAGRVCRCRPGDQRTNGLVPPRGGSLEEQLAASIDRVAGYLAAGADCVYSIAAVDPGVIRALVEGIPGLLNAGYAQGKLLLANLAAEGLEDVIAAAERGIHRIRGSHHLAFSFLRHCGLSLW